MQRRQDVAEEHRTRVLAILSAQYDTAQPASTDETLDATARGVQLIVNPRLPDDEIAGRRARVQALWRIGRHNEVFQYAPVLIKYNEVIEHAASRRVLAASLEALSPIEATYLDGVGPRSTMSVTRNGMSLAHATRLLQSLGIGDPRGRVAMIDRGDRVWWFELGDPSTPRFNLDLYDAEFAIRHCVVEAHDEWHAGLAAFPTTPYWHKDCEECPYREHCLGELEAKDDVSLVHYTSREQQALLHAAGIHTRHDLAALRPEACTKARQFGPEDEPIEMALSTSIERLPDLIYRARAITWGTFLRAVPPAQVYCPTADVEVDVDMESYNDVTYLWGAHVRCRVPVEGLRDGYVGFVTWDPLDAVAEATIFRDFWRWFTEVRAVALAAGHTLAAYCFWAQAENGAMDRATATPGFIDAADVLAFRRQQPPQWIDLHEHAKRSIQTDGPLGLKHLARRAGFAWRDENPSGEASMLWYERAVAGEEDAAAMRERILAYNEDDCRATVALRDWLNGPAKELPSRDLFRPDDASH